MQTFKEVGCCQDIKLHVWQITDFKIEHDFKLIFKTRGIGLHNLTFFTLNFTSDLSAIKDHGINCIINFLRN